MNILDLAGKAHPMTQAARGAKGAEHHGPCPGCGGDDRFHVWPEQNGGQGSYWCRQCGKAGDLIQYLRDFEGMTFKEAARAAGKTLDDTGGGFRQSAGPDRRAFVPLAPSDPAGVDRTRWSEAAEKFIERCHAALMASPDHLAWLAARGVDKDNAAAYRLGWHPGENGRNCAFRAREGWGLPPEKSPTAETSRCGCPGGS